LKPGGKTSKKSKVKTINVGKQGREKNKKCEMQDYGGLSQSQETKEKKSGLKIRIAAIGDVCSLRFWRRTDWGRKLEPDASTKKRSAPRNEKLGRIRVLQV